MGVGMVAATLFVLFSLRYSDTHPVYQKFFLGGMALFLFGMIFLLAYTEAKKKYEKSQCCPHSKKTHDKFGCKDCNCLIRSDRAGIQNG